MAKLQMLKPRVNEVKTDRVQSLPRVRDRRVTGRKLQDRRLKVWARNPNCAHCGKLCDFPGGFELDHRVPLHQGGEDIEDNCQVLCSGPDGCHAKKTAQDLRGA